MPQLTHAGLEPRQIDILVTNCSIYCPTPSMAAMLVNTFGMRDDIQAYHLVGRLHGHRLPGPAAPCMDAESAVEFGPTAAVLGQIRADPRVS
jgi:hypothetical protein